MKHCTRCDTSKPLGEFNNSKKGAQGKQRYCRDCQKAHYQENRALRIQQSADSKNARRGSLYGLTPEEHDALRVSNDGLCHLCNTRPATDIDHDHHTGKVRGHLCSTCNRGLGLFGDTVDGLSKALLYLQGSDSRMGVNIAY